MRKKKVLIIAIRGTSSSIDWVNNISIVRQHNDNNRGFYKHLSNITSNNKFDKFFQKKLYINK